MTKSELLKYIDSTQNLKAYAHDFDCSIEEAEEALRKEQPSQKNESNTLEALDCVSRKKAIDAIEAYFGDLPIVVHHDMVQLIKKLPSANQWIPCSERLPEEYHEVWVTIKGFDVIKVEEGETMKEAAERVSKTRWVTRGSWSEEEKCWIDNQFGFPLICQPVAWMEMNEPEPWKGEEDA